MHRKAMLLLIILSIFLGITTTSVTGYGASQSYVTMALANEEAKILNKIGLLAGTGSGYALEDTPTRLQGVIMLIRLMGEENEAKACTYNHPFLDVPDWGDRYVAWAFNKGYTYGTSDTTFSSNDPMTAQQYIAFTLRALGYGSDTTYFTTIEDARKFGLIPSDAYGDASVPFLRADMVHVTYLALQTYEKSTAEPLYQYLVDKNAIDPIVFDPALLKSVQELAEEVEKSVIPEEFQNLLYYNANHYERYVSYKALKPELDFSKVILNVNIGLDKPFYTDIKEISQSNYNRIDVLVNKYNKLPDSYKPKLEQIPSSLCASGVGKQYLRKDAKDAFVKMHNDAKKLGLNITAYGTYRSIQTQHDIWNRKVRSGRTIEDVDSLNARGGHSEHHTGLAVDVIKNDYSVEKTKEFKWYKENAHLYGFIIRYPKGKENITGYAYEPWHLRYVGVEIATEVYKSGLTYEEYYAMYIEPTVK